METDKPSSSAHLAHADLTDAVIRAFYDVANELGHGFSEEVLTRALVVLLLHFGKRAEVKRKVVGDPLNSLPLLRAAEATLTSACDAFPNESAHREDAEKRDP